MNERLQRIMKSEKRVEKSACKCPAGFETIVNESAFFLFGGGSKKRTRRKWQRGNVIF